MRVLLFGVTNRLATLSTSTGRTMRVARTELQLQFWDGTSFSTDSIGLWDTGADFFSVSEEFADRHGIDWRSSNDQLAARGVTGSTTSVFVPFVFRLKPIPDVAFRVDCQVLLDTDFPRPLLGNRFIRRNFNVNTVGERRTYFRLREPAPDAVSLAQLRAA